MNATDIVVVPSIATPKWVEQFGRVVPEALACGNFVVASDSGALPEVVGDAGRLFKSENIAELAKCLNEVLSSMDSICETRQARSQYAINNLSLQSQAESMNAVLARFREVS